MIKGLVLRRGGAASAWGGHGALVLCSHPCRVALSQMLRDPTCALILQQCKILRRLSLGRELCGLHGAIHPLPCSCLQTCSGLGQMAAGRRLHPLGHQHFPVSQARLIAWLPSDPCPKGSSSAPGCPILCRRGDQAGLWDMLTPGAMPEGRRSKRGCKQLRKVPFTWEKKVRLQQAEREPDVCSAFFFFFQIPGDFLSAV